MSISTPHLEAAVGLRVKTGWASCVLLGGPTSAPAALARCHLQLSDPADPESRQPYHAGTGKAQEDPVVIARRIAAVEHWAEAAIANLIAGYRHDGYLLRSAGVVFGSTTDPMRIGSLHMRAHALEGQLFRSVVERGLTQLGLTVLAVPERELLARATSTLDRSEDALRTLVTDLGRSLGAPWRSEEKAATLVAWLARADRGPERPN